MEISIERSRQHCCPNEGSNSEHFAHKNDAVTGRLQLHTGFLVEWSCGLAVKASFSWAKSSESEPRLDISVEVTSQC